MRSSGARRAGQRRATVVEVAAPAVGDVSLTLARVTLVEGRQATIAFGEAFVAAEIDPSVDDVVVRTAWERGERMVVAREGDRFVIVGSLRTTATPGVDDADELVIRAKRLTVLASHEFAVVAGATSFAMRAIGHVETIAENLSTRATGVHKLVGRILRLN